MQVPGSETQGLCPGWGAAPPPHDQPSGCTIPGGWSVEWTVDALSMATPIEYIHVVHCGGR